LSPRLGRHHPTIRRLRALGRDPALRREQSVFVAEGFHLAQEALKSGADVELVLFSERLSTSGEGRSLLREIHRRQLSSVETDAAVLDSIQDTRSPQPVLMLVRRPDRPPRAGLGESGPAPLVVGAVGIQDPGNLGSLLRTADAAGATAFFVARGSADPFHPRAVRATMGSIFRMPLHLVTMRDLVRRLRERGLRLIGAQPDGGVAYDRCDFARPTAIFFGSEGTGLPPPLCIQLDESVRVPMREGVDSLSVGAAAAVVLFEAARQRHRVDPEPRETRGLDQPSDL
jgi:TrmH family RNA methyltransferase